MVDFCQDMFTTLHDLHVDVDYLEDRLREVSNERSMSLIIPMLYQELTSPALYQIRRELVECDYLRQVVIALSANSAGEYARAVHFFEDLDLPTLVLWCDGPAIKGVLQELRDRRELDLLSFQGKGRDAWLALGVSSINSYAMALHDADIITYDRGIPAKLLFPLVEPELGFYFNKGYYARVSKGNSQMYGRVFRLFVHPLIDALSEIQPESGFLRYMRAFRYTLSGEFAMTWHLAMNTRIPADWGLEVGMLSEMFRNTTCKRICQTDLGFYDHKHKELGADRSEGLLRMSGDILKTLLRTLTETSDVTVNSDFLRSLQVKFRRFAQDCIRQYHADAAFNHLDYSRHREESTVDLFANMISEVGLEYLQNPSGSQIPDWARVISAMPKIRERLRDAAIEEREALTLQPKPT